MSPQSDVCDPGRVAEDPRREFAARDQPGATRPFPRSAYVFGWLAICLVAAEGVRSLVSGLYGTGVILVALVPAMVWLMHVRPHREQARRRRG